MEGEVKEKKSSLSTYITKLGDQFCHFFILVKMKNVMHYGHGIDVPSSMSNRSHNHLVLEELYSNLLITIFTGGDYVHKMTNYAYYEKKSCAFFFFNSHNRANKIHPKSRTFKIKVNQSYNISKENVCICQP